mmetsp:Transcript_34004/g.89433  ORF Transcript_34004/g.89433 Transcript_34004/m.89433 type:complete len:213 (+) Transcript_34004:898-1536(+)
MSSASSSASSISSSSSPPSSSTPLVLATVVIVASAASGAAKAVAVAIAGADDAGAGRAEVAPPGPLLLVVFAEALVLLLAMNIIWLPRGLPIMWWFMGCIMPIPPIPPMGICMPICCGFIDMFGGIIMDIWPLPICCIGMLPFIMNWLFIGEGTIVPLPHDICCMPPAPMFGTIIPLPLFAIIICICCCDIGCICAPGIIVKFIVDWPPEPI